MRSTLIRLGSVLPLLAALLTGCGSARLPYLDDPYLVSKKPIPGKAGLAEPLRVALAEPVPPAIAPEALAFLPTRPRKRNLDEIPFGDLASRTLLESSGSTDLRSVPILPMTRARTDRLPELPVGREKAAGRYACAPDYRWLQGTVQRHPNGWRELCFANPAEVNGRGGTVRLDDDPRLEEVRSGAWVWVSGKLGSGESASRSEVDRTPRYRVSAILVLD